jgi:hypothetical protein
MTLKKIIFRYEIFNMLFWKVETVFFSHMHQNEFYVKFFNVLVKFFNVLLKFSHKSLEDITADLSLQTEKL